ncbi:P27 family phage terminase small subunit [Streptomyces sp. NPDC048242]|uniref:P27 family phage terminase small subunit n=1 Tax=Streptomyces sp. NPDC048242 TaxID=3155026 RepID=UPI003432518C
MTSGNTRTLEGGTMSNLKISAEFRQAVLAVFDVENFELTTLDRACAVLDQIQEMEHDVTTRGAVVRGIRGGIGPNPCLKELRAAEASFMALVRSLGLNDADGGMDGNSRSAAARAMNRARWGVRGGTA